MTSSLSEIKMFLESLDYEHDQILGEYVMKTHLTRLAETLAVVPAKRGGCLLEIGARTPTLAFCRKFLAYEVVQGHKATWESDEAT